MPAMPATLLPFCCQLITLKLVTARMRAAKMPGFNSGTLKFNHLRIPFMACNLHSQPMTDLSDFVPVEVRK